MDSSSFWTRFEVVMNILVQNLHFIPECSRGYVNELTFAIHYGQEHMKSMIIFSIGTMESKLVQFFQNLNIYQVQNYTECRT